MKKKILSFSFLFLFSSAPFFSLSQVVVDSPEYHQRKLSGTLDGVEVVPNPNGGLTTVNPVSNPNSTTINPKSAGCECYVDPDPSYSIAIPPGDDGSSAEIALPFTFSFYGQSFTSLHINHNGNVTFGGGLAAYSPSAFPSLGSKIVAPFWGDVDTRLGNGRIVYKVTPHAIYVNWENVGYFWEQGDKRNTFQLILTDGTDPAIPAGQNIAFCYKTMEWTTGGKSGGVNGFGGYPATVGANKGDDVLFFQLGQFDHSGTDFNGAFGAASGVEWLNNKSFFFNITNSTNTPPIANSVTACDTFKICAIGDTADIPVAFFSPEAAQTTSITYTTSSPGIITELSNTAGNTATIIFRVIGSLASAGYHDVTVTATDNGTPVGVTTLSFVVFIDPNSGTNLNPILTPPGGCEAATLSVLNGPYDSYFWDDLSVATTNTVSNSGIQGVTVSKNGCYKRVDGNVLIMPGIVADIRGGSGFCPGASSSEVYIADSLKYNSISWGLSNVARDTMFSNFFVSGELITIHLVDSAGLCSLDTTFTLTQQMPVQLVADFDKCILTHQMTGNTGGSGFGKWTVYNSPGTPTFSNSTTLNPNITFPTFGTYHLVFKDDFCNAVDTIHVNLVQPPNFDFGSDFFACPFDAEHLVFKDSALIKEYHWGFPIAAQDTIFTANLYQGTYTASYEMFLGCSRDTTFTITSQPPTELFDYGMICGDTLTMNMHVGSLSGQWTVESMPGNVPPVFSNSTQLHSRIKISEYGDYVLKFEGECDEPKSTSIQFRPYPKFTLNDAEICLGESHVFNVAKQAYVDDYVWHDGSTGTSFPTSQLGMVYLTATNICGIFTDSASLASFVCDLDFPNVFTPDGDGANEVWTSLAHPDGFISFELNIFNRWGNVVHTYDDINGSWNGETSSGPATEGVYFYTLNAVTKNDKEMKIHGFFHLIRK